MPPITNASVMDVAAITKLIGSKPSISMLRDMINPADPYDEHIELTITSTGGSNTAVITTQDKPILITQMTLSVFALVGGVAKKVTQDLTARDIINLEVSSAGNKLTNTVMELEHLQNLAANPNFVWLIGARQSLSFTLSQVILTAGNFTSTIKGYVDLSGHYFHREAAPVVGRIVSET